MLESLDSTKVSLNKVLEIGKGREAWGTASHGVEYLELAGQLKNSNNSVSHMLIRRRFSNLKYGIMYITRRK